MSTKFLTVSRLSAVRVQQFNVPALEIEVDMQARDFKQALSVVLEGVTGDQVYEWLCELAPDFVAEIRGELNAA